MTQPAAGSGEPRMTEEAPGAVDAPRRGRAAVTRQAGDPRETRETRLQNEREANDREQVEERELSEDERLEFFRASLMQEMLPSLPKIPGYHVCWLSTNHKSDTIAWRTRLGYTLIRAEELLGFDGSSLKAGDYAGVVAVNEMVAAKIPLSLYNKYMNEVHHQMPQQEQDKLRARIELMKQQAREMGSDVIEGDGNAELMSKARPMPVLTE